ncbi:50S ribosomal protein L25/general stress protein Ctc [Auritidibacter ignavus]|uniref:Large ribosomal subunit protein bL25 n=1 Tax=Auritidibacter ignavus TaxID=678932 RepID=A0AAJ6AQ56_9MICC|nr:50S ribosomal protein L25/general stress protein Ctc [Auritidibacter ignavus]WGH94271.1 50S ribosomal protein L25/general stress protein Ctc [Auritidibacter ignavus]
MAIDTVNINVEFRTDTGKGASRQARREGKIPAVIYGHGSEPRHILMPEYDTFMALRTPNQLLKLTADGEEIMALAKDIQRNPLKEKIEHVDLLIVRRGEKVVVDVPVEVEGEVAPGFTYFLEEASLPIEADALDLPDSVTVSVEGREGGNHVLASDVQLPAGTSLQLEDDAVIATVDEIVEQDLGEEPEEGTEGDEAASGDEANSQGSENSDD